MTNEPETTPPETPREKMLRRIRKVLELSKNNPNVEEASHAAALATQLMLKYQIREDELIVEDEKPEAVVDQDVYTYETSKLPTWKVLLIHHVSVALGGRSYRFHARDAAGRYILRPDGSYQIQHRVVGTESTVQTVTYLARYLMNEIEQLGDRAWEAEKRSTRVNGKTWKNSFRMGALNVVTQRLDAERAAQRQKVQTMETQARETGAACMALVLYQTDQERVEAFYAETSKRLNLGHSSMRTVSRSANAYEQGRAAGRGISLGGGKQLQAAAKQIRP